MKRFFIVLVVLLISSVVSANDSWNIDVQNVVFKRVAELMKIKLNESENPPPVLCAEDMTDSEFALAIGDKDGIWGSIRGNFFSWRLNSVILTKKRCFVHVLAHEYVHYFQYHYEMKKDPSLFRDYHEKEAIQIQDFFR